MLPETGPATIPDDKIRRHNKRCELMTYNLTSQNGKGILIIYPNHPKNLIGSHFVWNGTSYVFDKNLYTAQELPKSYNYGRKISQVVTVRSTTLPAGVYALTGTINAVTLDGPPSEIPTWDYNKLLSYTTNPMDKVCGVLVNDGVGILTLPTTFDNDYLRMGDPTPTSNTTTGTVDFTQEPTLNPSLNSVSVGTKFGIQDPAARTLATAVSTIFAKTFNLDSTEGVLASVTLKFTTTTNTANASLALQIQTLDLFGAVTDTVLIQRPLVSGTTDSSITIGSSLLGMSGSLPNVAPTAAVKISLIGNSSSGTTSMTNSVFLVSATATSLSGSSPGTNNPVSVLMYDNLTPGGYLTVNGVSNFELIPNSELRKNITTDFGFSDPAEMDYVKTILGMRDLFELRTVWDLSQYDSRRSLLGEFANLDKNEMAQAWEWSDVLWWIKKTIGAAAPIVGALYPPAAPLTGAIAQMANAASGKPIGTAHAASGNSIGLKRLALAQDDDSKKNRRINTRRAIGKGIAAIIRCIPCVYAESTAEAVEDYTDAPMMPHATKNYLQFLSMFPVEVAQTIENEVRAGIACGAQETFASIYSTTIVLKADPTVTIQILKDEIQNRQREFYEVDVIHDDLPHPESEQVSELCDGTADLNDHLLNTSQIEPTDLDYLCPLENQDQDDEAYDTDGSYDLSYSEDEDDTKATAYAMESIPKTLGMGPRDRQRTAAGRSMNATGVLFPCVVENRSGLKLVTFAAIKGDHSDAITNELNTCTVTTTQGGTIHGLSREMDYDSAEQLPITGHVTLLPVSHLDSNHIMIPDAQNHLGQNSWECAAVMADKMPQGYGVPRVYVTGRCSPTGEFQELSSAPAKKLLIQQVNRIPLITRKGGNLNATNAEAALSLVEGFTNDRPVKMTRAKGKALSAEYLDLPPPPEDDPSEIVTVIEGLVDKLRNLGNDGLYRALQIGVWLNDNGLLDDVEALKKRDPSGNKLFNMIHVAANPEQAPYYANDPLRPSPEMAKRAKAHRIAEAAKGSYKDITVEWVIENGYTGPSSNQAKYYSKMGKLPAPGDKDPIVPIAGAGKRLDPGRLGRIAENIIASNPNWTDAQIDEITRMVNQMGRGLNQEELQDIVDMNETAATSRAARVQRNQARTQRAASRPLPTSGLARYLGSGVSQI